MTCLDIDTMVELVEGTASEATRTRVEAHLVACDDCRMTLSTLVRRDDAPAAIAAPGGRYQIARELGSGGMGVVYAAYDPELDRTVALKVLRGDRRAGLESRLHREAKAMAKLAHPNIAAVYDVGTFGDRTFVAMEFVDGETLARWAARHGPAEILNVYREAGRGLAAAHAAGLVHRDFKPENVMVGVDGRARVVDFGLAQPDGDAGEAGAVTLAGTPHYMAPELFDGSPASARSDQFSFCVALAVSLTGSRPFAGDSWTLDSLHKIPRRVRRVLRRGLAIDPARRFSTLDALLAGLAPPRRRWLWAAATIALAALAFAIASWSARAPAPCSGGDDRLRGVWDADRKRAIERAVLAVGVPYAAATSQQLGAIIDRYANDWRAMQLDACQATRVRGEASEAVLDLRTTCLDARLRELDALGTALLATDRTTLARAVAAAQDLSPIDDCADRAALDNGARPPSASLRPEVDRLGRELAALRSARDLGTYQAASAQLPPVLAAIRALGYRPLEAAALALDGSLADDASQFERARAAFEAAILAAEAGRDDATAATAAIEQLTVVGIGLGRPRETGPLEERAGALLERLNRPPALRARLLFATGNLAIATARLADADRDLGAALALAEQVDGPTDIRLVEILRALARIEILRTRPEVARGYLERALAIQKQVLGDAHPDLAATWQAIGGMRYTALDNEGALAAYREAQAIDERAFGSDSAAVANVLDNIALVYEWQGKADEAVVIHRRAIAIDVQTLGLDHPTTIAHRSALAGALEDEGQSDEAFQILTEVLAQERARLGPEHQQIGATLGSLALTELSLEKYDLALAHAGEARTMLAHVLGDSYRPVAELAAMGRALLGLGRAREAVEVLEQARAAVDGTIDDGTVTLLDSQLGRALVVAGGDVPRGRALVLESWAKIAKDPRMDDDRKVLERWMSAHGIAVPR